MAPAMTGFSAARLILAAAFGGLAFTAPANAGPGDRQYATIVNHDPSAFLKALRAGGDFIKGGGRQFRIILAASGVIVVIPGTSTVQREYMQTKRSPGLEIIVCKETLDALAKANRRRIPVLPGVSVQSCNSLRNKMTVAGWQTAPGI